MAFSVFTPLVSYNEIEKRPEYSTGSPTARSSSRRVLASLFVYILVLSSLTAVIYHQLLKPHGNQHSTATTTITSALREFQIKPPTIRVGWQDKVVGADYSVGWQRSIYHFQPDKNIISGMHQINI